MDQGNTAFMLIAAALVLLMTPGLAFFYGGLVKAKSVISMMMLSFGALGLIGHLAHVHPSRYVGLVHGLDALGLRDVRVLHDQNDALRFVALVDRLYDAQVALRSSGTTLDAVFSEEMLGGGYRKKYLRAISRLVALANERWS